MADTLFTLVKFANGYLDSAPGDQGYTMTGTSDSSVPATAGVDYTQPRHYGVQKRDSFGSIDALRRYAQSLNDQLTDLRRRVKSMAVKLKGNLVNKALQLRQSSNTTTPTPAAPTSANWYDTLADSLSHAPEDASEDASLEALLDEGSKPVEPAFDWGLLYPQLQSYDSSTGSQHSTAGPSEASSVAATDTESVDISSAASVMIPSAVSSTTTLSTPTPSTLTSSAPTSTPTPYSGPTLGELLKNAFPKLANKTKHPPPEHEDDWVDGLFHDPLPSSAIPSPSPTSDASDSFPLIMGPGSYIPEGVSISWPHSHLQSHPSPSSIVDNLESMPTLTDDLGAEDEDAFRKFIEDLSKEGDEQVERRRRQLSTAPTSLFLSTSDDVSSLLSPPFLISPSSSDGTPSILSPPTDREQCQSARQTLQSRLTIYRAQLSEPCGLGPNVEIPVPLQKQMQDALEKVCALKREKLKNAYGEVQELLEGGSAGWIGCLGE
jgi:hypothetical protein